MTAAAALLTGLIDYAGLYPPASLSLEETCENYASYLQSPQSWMLRRLVLPLAKLRTGDGWRISLIVESEPGPQPPQVESFETKIAHRLSLPTYCEAPPGKIQSGFAKIRTGGDSVPTSEQLADFLCEAAGRRMAFKATAGLHRALRSPQMHGFLNVFLGAAFAWHGAGRAQLLDVLDDSSAGAFAFSGETVRWRGQELGAAQIAAARRDFAHSFGSCSFEEPLADLRELGLLP